MRQADPVTFLRTFSTLGCPELDLEAVIALATKHGVGAVELRCLAGSMDLPGQLAAAYGSPAAQAPRNYILIALLWALSLVAVVGLAKRLSPEIESALESTIAGSISTVSTCPTRGSPSNVCVVNPEPKPITPTRSKP